MSQSTSAWPTWSKFAKKKKKDLDVFEIKKNLVKEGRRTKVTHEDLFGSKKKVDRGWGAPDAVGWGVLGHHGSCEKDTRAQRRVSNSNTKAKLIRNENGLWIKKKMISNGEINNQREIQSRSNENDHKNKGNSQHSDSRYDTGRKGKKLTAESV